MRMFRSYAAERCPGCGRKGSDRVSRRKAVWGWMLFDWANQPWYTLIVTYVFGPYFVSRVAADPVHGQAVWGYAIAAASVVVALSAPVLGAIADAQAMGSCLLGALCRRCGRSLGRGAGARRSDRHPGFSRDRTDRSRVYGGLHQRRVAGAGRQGRDRPHLRVGLGVGLLGRACEPGAGARPDRACAGLGTDRHRP